MSFLLSDRAFREVEMAENIERKAREWKTIPELRGSGLQRLFTDLAEAEKNQTDAEERVKALRLLIQPLIQDKDYPVRVGSRVAAWRPETETTRLDEAKLVQAGVTPDQLAAGTVKGKKRGYMEIRTLKGEQVETEETALTVILSAPGADTSTPPVPVAFLESVPEIESTS